MKKLLTSLVIPLFMYACTNAETPAEKPVPSTADEQKTETKEAKEVKQGYQIGDVATDFNLTNVDDTQVALANYPEAKGFIVIFTCNHCPYAKAYEDRIIALDAKYKALGYPVIAISPNDAALAPGDSFENMKIRAQEKGFTFPYLYDEGQKIYPQYGATKTPHVFILNKENGKNIVKYIGAIDDNYADPSDVSKTYVQDAVDALLKGEKIEVTKTVAIGCSIKTEK